MRTVLGQAAAWPAACGLLTTGGLLTACGLLAACGLLTACGAGGGITGNGDQPLFGGRTVEFHSTYVYFPSDFSMSIVRDTMPQDDACRILKMYAGQKPPLPGLPVLPYSAEHYALVITVDSVQPGDDVTIDKSTTGGEGDMRYAGIGQYGVGNNQAPLWAEHAGGIIRISSLTQYQHVDGRFNLQFDTGEQIAEDFSVDACAPKNPA
jgi:hypothetical protein